MKITKVDGELAVPAVDSPAVIFSKEAAKLLLSAPVESLLEKAAREAISTFHNDPLHDVAVVVIEGTNNMLLIDQSKGDVQITEIEAAFLEQVQGEERADYAFATFAFNEESKQALQEAIKE